MKIALLYICTGKYDIFWPVFHDTCEKFFLAEHEKHFFVFTDSDAIKDDGKRVHRVWQEKLGWPHDTLMRFHMFRGVEYELRKFDFLMFFNANAYFVDAVGDEYLPTPDEGLLFQRHPGYYNKGRLRFPYERRRRSTAYIPYWRGKHYLFGAMSGGFSEPYLAMVSALCRNIDTDKDNGIIALWHDESQLNRYALDVRYKLLHPGYMYPDDWDLPFERKIALLDKAKFGGADFMRGIATDGGGETSEAS